MTFVIFEHHFWLESGFGLQTIDDLNEVLTKTTLIFLIAMFCIKFKYISI